MLTSSSSSLSSWPSTSSSSSLNSNASSFAPAFHSNFLSLNQNQSDTMLQLNNQVANSQLVESNKKQRPITGIRSNFNSKQHKASVIQNLTQFTNNPFAFASQLQTHPSTAKYSRKVFVGGLPPDIDQDEINLYFQVYGSLIVDWPHKSETKSVYPPKGYVFLIFDNEKSVQDLISSCQVDKDKLYLYISSKSIKDKPIQIRPWTLIDTDYILDANQPIDPRKTIFVGGVPRPLKSLELALIMERLYGGVCYACIDTDSELRYPKGAGRVSFSNQQSYVAAISARFVQLQQGDIDKRAEVKPYVLDEQVCDLCSGMRCGGKTAPFFCANITCLQYYCESCWSSHHSKPGKDFHKPLVKEGADRPRTIPFKWC